MPRLSRPVYRAERDQWYVRHDGRRITLNVQGRANRQAAELAFRELLAGRPPAAPSPRPSQDTRRGAGGPTLAELCELFLEAKGRTAAPITARSYRWRVNNLTVAVGADTPADSLTPNVLERAVCQDRWSPSYRGDLINLARMVSRWAVANRLLDRDPLAGVKRPTGPPKRPDVRLTAADLNRLLGHCSPALRGLVAFLYATGARPSEAREITAADVDLTRGLVVLTAHKTSTRTGEARLIAVPEGEGRAALAAACVRFPSGPVFRRPSGRPWNRTTLCHAFRRARAQAGLPETLTPYTLRHLFCTDALTKGVPDATVAALVGHRSTRMIHARYSHLLSRADLLAQAAGQVRAAALPA